MTDKLDKVEGAPACRATAFMRLATAAYGRSEQAKIRSALLAYAMPGETYGYDRVKKVVWSYSDLSDATVIAVANALDLDELPPPRAYVRHISDKDHPNDYINVVAADEPGEAVVVHVRQPLEPPPVHLHPHHLRRATERTLQAHHVPLAERGHR